MVGVEERMLEVSEERERLDLQRFGSRGSSRTNRSRRKWSATSASSLGQIYLRLWSLGVSIEAWPGAVHVGTDVGLGLAGVRIGVAVRRSRARATGRLCRPVRSQIRAAAARHRPARVAAATQCGCDCPKMPAMDSNRPRRHRAQRTGRAGRTRSRTPRHGLEKGPKVIRPSPGPQTHWGEVADWYDRLVGDEGASTSRRSIHPGVVRLLGLAAGRSVIDVACGQGRALPCAGRARRGRDRGGRGRAAHPRRPRAGAERVE